MDKSNIVNDKKNVLSVHRLPHGRQTVHRDYGLWISGGYSGASQVDSFRSCPLRYFEFYSLSHLYDGEGFLSIPGQGEYEVHPGDALLMVPNLVHRYGGFHGKAYIEDNIRFCGAVADTFLRAGVLRPGVLKFGCIRKILPIRRMSLEPSQSAQLAANVALQNLLLEIFNRNGSDSEQDFRIESLLELIRERMDYWWTVKELADMANLCEMQFRRKFFARTGMNPKEYLEQYKIKHAMELLAARNCSIREVAKQLGYRDPFHFSRRFKILTGISPEAYSRKQ